MECVYNKRKMLSVFKIFYIRIFFFAAFPLFIPDLITAQIDTVRVPSDLFDMEGNLNFAVESAADAGKLSSTIFLLEPNGRYVLTDSILIPAGENLKILAPEPGITQETAPPQIICSAKSDDWVSQIKYLFVCEGNLTLKNIWLLHANTSGLQNGACTVFRDDSNRVQTHKCDFDGVILDYSSIPRTSGGAVTVACKNFIGKFTNCYWKNCTDLHFRYYGRAVSFPYSSTGYHIDSLSFENCTFANIGYVLMQENGEYSDNVKFNHCTFLNVVMYSLESGWWHNLSVTNSIFTNPFMYGYMPAFVSFDNNQPESGTFSIDSISTFDFTVPFTEQERHILFTNSSYFVEDWLREWMFENPYSRNRMQYGEYDLVPQPQPMLNDRTIDFFESTENNQKKFPFINKSALYDSTNPGFITPPTDTTQIKSFIYHKWNDSVDTLWAWKPQNSFDRLWPLEENLAYGNQKLLTGGMGDFPLGDLYHWFPDKYEQWKTQKESEDARIKQWLEFGKDPGIVNVDENIHSKLPDNYKLFQNYPNPFNPTTTIKFSIPKSNANFASTATKVTLKVYDILGREVDIIVNDQKSFGNYDVTFDGSKLTSGVYFYQLRAVNCVETKKMVLLK